MPGNRRGVRRIGTIVFLTVLALLPLAWGSFILWGQLSGVPGRMTVEECSSNGTFLDLFTPDCYGQLIGAPATPQIWNGWWGDKGHDINVHLHGSGMDTTAFKDSWLQPLIWLGLGFLLAFYGIWAMVRPAPPLTAENADPSTSI